MLTSLAVDKGILVVRGMSPPSKGENAPSGRQRGSVHGGTNVHSPTLPTLEARVKVLRAASPRDEVKAKLNLVLLAEMRDLPLLVEQKGRLRRVAAQTGDRHLQPDPEGQAFLPAERKTGFLANYLNRDYANAAILVTIGMSLVASSTELARVEPETSVYSDTATTSQQPQSLQGIHLKNPTDPTRVTRIKRLPKTRLKPHQLRPSQKLKRRLRLPGGC